MIHTSVSPQRNSRIGFGFDHGVAATWLTVRFWLTNPFFGAARAGFLVALGAR